MRVSEALSLPLWVGLLLFFLISSTHAIKRPRAILARTEMTADGEVALTNLKAGVHARNKSAKQSQKQKTDKAPQKELPTPTRIPVREKPSTALVEKQASSPSLTQTERSEEVSQRRQSDTQTGPKGLNDRTPSFQQQEQQTTNDSNAGQSPLQESMTAANATKKKNDAPTPVPPPMDSQPPPPDHQSVQPSASTTDTGPSTQDEASSSTVSAFSESTEGQGTAEVEVVESSKGELNESDQRGGSDSAEGQGEGQSLSEVHEQRVEASADGEGEKEKESTEEGEEGQSSFVSSAEGFPSPSSSPRSSPPSPPTPQADASEAPESEAAPDDSSNDSHTESPSPSAEFERDAVSLEEEGAYPRQSSSFLSDPIPPALLQRVQDALVLIDRYERRKAYDEKWKRQTEAFRRAKRDASIAHAAVFAERRRQRNARVEAARQAAELMGARSHAEALRELSRRVAPVAASFNGLAGEVPHSPSPLAREVQRQLRGSADDISPHLLDSGRKSSIAWNAAGVIANPVEHWEANRPLLQTLMDADEVRSSPKTIPCLVALTPDPASSDESETMESHALAFGLPSPGSRAFFDRGPQVLEALEPDTADFSWIGGPRNWREFRWKALKESGVTTLLWRPFEMERKWRGLWPALSSRSSHWRLADDDDPMCRAIREPKVFQQALPRGMEVHPLDVWKANARVRQILHEALTMHGARTSCLWKKKRQVGGRDLSQKGSSMSLGDEEEEENFQKGEGEEVRTEKASVLAIRLDSLQNTDGNVFEFTARGFTRGPARSFSLKGDGQAEDEFEPRLGFIRPLWPSGPFTHLLFRPVDSEANRRVSEFFLASASEVMSWQRLRPGEAGDKWREECDEMKQRLESPLFVDPDILWVSGYFGLDIPWLYSRDAPSVSPSSEGKRSRTDLQSWRFLEIFMNSHQGEDNSLATEKPTQVGAEDEMADSQGGSSRPQPALGGLLVFCLILLPLIPSKGL